LKSGAGRQVLICALGQRAWEGATTQEENAEGQVSPEGGDFEDGHFPLAKKTGGGAVVKLNETEGRKSEAKSSQTKSGGRGPRL